MGEKAGQYIHVTLLLAMISSLLFCTAPKMQQNHSDISSNIPTSAKKTKEELSARVFKAWHELKIGMPVYALDDLANTPGWIDNAFIEKIWGQSGIWNIHIEEGHSLFRILLYLVGEPEYRTLQGIHIKVNGEVSVEEFVASIKKRDSSLRIKEYELFPEQ
jgi:hypothetical protein